MENTEAMIADRLFRMQLADIRKAKRLTQEQVSKLSGLSKSCISNIESGSDSSPTLRSLIRYMTAIDADIFIKQN
jgi:DNA-binding helix-turn-helix protein|nr:MAG TPA: helix-turn-helix domain protein [Bacteriophage sp.]DAY22565.1 MAG TPA: helix-turn-helix domain protein [Caudoviricetes sp.]